jgi:hypothetical protein
MAVYAALLCAGSQGVLRAGWEWLGDASTQCCTCDIADYDVADYAGQFSKLVNLRVTEIAVTAFTICTYTQPFYTGVACIDEE